METEYQTQKNHSRSWWQLWMAWFMICLAINSCTSSLARQCIDDQWRIQGQKYRGASCMGARRATGFWPRPLFFTKSALCACFHGSWYACESVIVSSGTSLGLFTLFTNSSSFACLFIFTSIFTYACANEDFCNCKYI